MYRWTLCEKIVFALPFDKSKSKYYYYDGDTYGHWNGILYVFYGMAMMYLHNGLHGDSFVSMYFSIFIKNFIMAYPLQLIIMGPLVRFYLERLF